MATRTICIYNIRSNSTIVLLDPLHRRHVNPSDTPSANVLARFARLLFRLLQLLNTRDDLSVLDREGGYPSSGGL